MILVFFCIFVAPVLHHLGCRVLKHGMRVGLPTKLMGSPVGAQFYPADKTKWAPYRQPTLVPHSDLLRPQLVGNPYQMV